MKKLCKNLPLNILVFHQARILGVIILSDDDDDDVLEFGFQPELQKTENRNHVNPFRKWNGNHLGQGKKLGAKLTVPYIEKVCLRCRKSTGRVIVQGLWAHLRRTSLGSSLVKDRYYMYIACS